MPRAPSYPVPFTTTRSPATNAEVSSTPPGSGETTVSSRVRPSSPFAVTVLGGSAVTLGFALAALFYDARIGLVIGLTLLAVCTVAATIGGVMPLLARAIRVDPAVFSNPFITTFVDATGLVIYFLIARAVLHL